MKKILYSILAASAIISCGDDELKNPNYPVEPSIKFVDLKFKEGEESEEIGGRESDELILTISYKDGDSDLGLGYNGEDVLYPYHRQNFFLEDGTGETISFPVQPEFIESAVGEDFLPVYIVKHGANSGTLVTTKTRGKANYDYLPEYDPMYSCLNYYGGIFYYAEEIVNEDDALNTITVDGKNFKQVKRPVLYKNNEHAYNISVKFYYFDSGEFVEYDFYKHNNCSDYNGRFPLIGDKKSGTIDLNGLFKIKVKNPWEGQITYTMLNSSFLSTFGPRALKLEITIKDRALHTSNTIVTPAFELNEIRQD